MRVPVCGSSSGLFSAVLICPADASIVVGVPAQSPEGVPPAPSWITGALGKPVASISGPWRVESRLVSIVSNASAEYIGEPFSRSSPAFLKCGIGQIVLVLDVAQRHNTSEWSQLADIVSQGHLIAVVPIASMAGRPGCQIVESRDRWSPVDAACLKPMVEVASPGSVTDANLNRALGGVWSPWARDHENARETNDGP